MTENKTGRYVNKEMEKLIGKEFKVLDKGMIRVVDYMGGDESIVQSARISYASGIKTEIEDKRLIDFLLRHRHTSPFEMCEIKLHVKMPMFVARQWIRHRTANVNEISARYSVLNSEFFIPELEDMSTQSSNQKQGRSKKLEESRAIEIRNKMTSLSQGAYDFYNEILEEDNLTRELARGILPVNMYTEIYWKIDLHNLLHFLSLRSKVGAQKEIRDYANVILNEIVKVWVPMIYDAFMKYNMNAVTFYAKDMEAISKIIDSGKLQELIAELKTSKKGEDREFKEKLESVLIAAKNIKENSEK